MSGPFAFSRLWHLVPSPNIISDTRVTAARNVFQSPRWSLVCPSMCNTLEQIETVCDRLATLSDRANDRRNRATPGDGAYGISDFVSRISSSTVALLRTYVIVLPTAVTFSAFRISGGVTNYGSGFIRPHVIAVLSTWAGLFMELTTITRDISSKVIDKMRETKEQLMSKCEWTASRFLDIKNDSALVSLAFTSTHVRTGMFELVNAVAHLDLGHDRVIDHAFAHLESVLEWLQQMYSRLDHMLSRVPEQCS